MKVVRTKVLKRILFVPITASFQERKPTHLFLEQPLQNLSPKAKVFENSEPISKPFILGNKWLQMCKAKLE